MKRLLVLVSLILTASLIGQVEHAPTVAQCQADQRLWLSDLEQNPHKLPEMSVIVKWNGEMGDCEKVDPDNRFRYYNTSGEIAAEEIARMQHFFDRHGLWTQFMDEDSAGKR